MNNESFEVIVCDPIKRELLLHLMHMYRGENFFRNKVLTEAIDFFKKFPFLIKSDVILPYRT